MKLFLFVILGFFSLLIIRKKNSSFNLINSSADLALSKIFKPPRYSEFVSLMRVKLIINKNDSHK